jgi:hypothetical protein
MAIQAIYKRQLPIRPRLIKVSASKEYQPSILLWNNPYMKEELRYMSHLDLV